MRTAAPLAIGFLLACAGAPQAPETTVLAGTPARVLLVMPFNVTAVMPEELALLSPVVWKEFEAYLDGYDKKLKTAAFRDARRLWLRSIQKARAEQGAEAGFEDAARLLIREFAEYAEFDTVILPSLFVRNAEFSDRTVSWDGVRRPLEFEAYGLGARHVAATTKLEGTLPAASLHVAVFDAEGNELHEGLGGLDVLVRIRVLDGGSVAREESFEFATRTDLFADRARLREGIAKALDPFLPRRAPEAD